MLRETAAVSTQVLCAPCNHAPIYSVILFETIIRYRVHVCLAATCRLHLWQNDRDLLRATAVTRGWNGYRSKSQHRKLFSLTKVVKPVQVADFQFVQTLLHFLLQEANCQIMSTSHLDVNLFVCILFLFHSSHSTLAGGCCKMPGGGLAGPARRCVVSSCPVVG